MALLPMISARAALGCIGLMKAAFGLRVDFFFVFAVFVAFFAVFLEAVFLVFFLVAIDSPTQNYETAKPSRKPRIKAFSELRKRQIAVFQSEKRKSGGKNALFPREN